MSSKHRPATQQRSATAAIQQFAAEFGWWRVVAIPILTVITAWVLVDVVRGDDVNPAANSAAATSAAREGDVGNVSEDEGADDQAGDVSETPSPVGPDPAQSEHKDSSIFDLPPGGKFTQKGEGTYRSVGKPGQEAGKGTEKTVRYAVEVENGVNTAGYGGDTAFAAIIDATLADPRGWIEEDRFRFVHVKPEDNPDTTFRLASADTTAQLCGSHISLETSCHTAITGASTVVINESRWVRGASPFEGDLGNYRQYLINHEFGHAIGYADHQPCTQNGGLAPVMMQQTLSLSNKELHKISPEGVYPDNGDTCEPNPWPYPNPGTKDAAAPKQPR